VKTTNRIPVAVKETDPEKYEAQLNRLRFQDSIEGIYVAYNLPGFLMGLRVGLGFAIFVNLCFYLIDRQITGLVPHLGWIDTFRYLVATPVLVLVGATTFFVRKDLVLNILALVALLALGTEVMLIMLPIPVQIKDYYWTSLNIIVLYPFLLMNMRYRFALASGVVVFLLFTTMGSSGIGMSHGGYMSAVGILGAALVMGAIGGYILERHKRRNFLQQYLTRLEVSDLQRSNIKLESLSHIDPLTDIPNRRFFDTNFEKEWARCRRDKLPISLLIVDIDRFKHYNDSYGHPAGDHVLKQVAKCLKKAVRRPADFVARYGGEEFAVVLADTDESGIDRTADRILESVRNLHISHDYREAGEEPYVTVSIGAASMIPNGGNNLDLLIELADKALYEAKRTGRNRLVKEEALEPAITE
jgi:diguanylate cyclase (GGDEF)-like protein